MSQYDFITELNGIKGISILDHEIKNTEFGKIVEYKAIQEDENCCCPHCNNKAIRYGKSRESRIIFGHQNKKDLYLLLKKQRYMCRECKVTFFSQSNLTNTQCHISNVVKNMILEDLTTKRSMKDIARDNKVSPSTVLRVLKSQNEMLETKYNYLPPIICIDEFRAFNKKKTNSKFAFCLVNGVTNKIIDVIADRKQNFLKTHFNRYTYPARKSVKLVCMDMYTPYIGVVKKVFPNAEIVFDRFHIVQNVSRELNNYRVSVMKKIPEENQSIKKVFKKYWRVLLKGRRDLKYNSAMWIPHLKTYKTEAQLLDLMLECDDRLFNSYLAYQDVVDAIRLKSDFLIERAINNKSILCTGIRTALNVMKRNKKYIINAIKNKCNNGATEANNNNIKVLKRIAYGYRNFDNFRARILLVFTDKLKFVA